MLHTYCSVRGCGSATLEEARPTRRHKADRGLLKIHRGRTYRSTASEHPVTPSHSSLQPSPSGRHPVTPLPTAITVWPSPHHTLTPSHSSLHPLTPSQLRRPRFGENLKQRQQAIKRYYHSLQSGTCSEPVHYSSSPSLTETTPQTMPLPQILVTSPPSTSECQIAGQVPYRSRSMPVLLGSGTEQKHAHHKSRKHTKKPPKLPPLKHQDDSPVHNNSQQNTRALPPITTNQIAAGSDNLQTRQ